MKSRLEEIKQRYEKATPEPWVWNECDQMVRPYCYEADDNTERLPTKVEIEKGEYFSAEEIIETDSGVYGPQKPDREFIAHSRVDIPWLVEKLETARRIIDSYSQSECLYGAKDFLKELEDASKG